MKKRWLLGILFCLFFIAPLVLGGVQSGIPKIDIPNDCWDFGKVKEGSVPQHIFMIKNTGTAELALNAYPSCRTCLSPELSRNNIPPKGEAELQITFFTMNKSGQNEAYAMIQSNDPEQPVKKITVKAFVIGKH